MAYKKGHLGDWDIKLPWQAMEYRFSRQASLDSFSPYFLLYGRDPDLPVAIHLTYVDKRLQGYAFGAAGQRLRRKMYAFGGVGKDRIKNRLEAKGSAAAPSAMREQGYVDGRRVKSNSISEHVSPHNGGA
ncbi:hypothetical protein AXG93_3559s1210 [Marchantia polymorpha subsp. ruderalis]|uniref:Uncharacterized protein n=1 Tax=Marchantia polymorpha subsp. ruderalis TaxID=1480154 RepID=A0A176WMP0_MARPO|nr:hypothetical protein AXG93_3559s1210 [Marchantia polymorpha subsp. ruderalis]